MRKRRHEALILTIELHIFIANHAAMHKKPVKPFGVTPAHIGIDIAHPSEFDRGDGTALHIALVSRQLQHRMGAGLVKGRIQRRIPGEDCGGIQRNRQILHVLDEFFRDIDIVFALIVAVQVENDIVGQGKLQKRRHEALGKCNRRIRPRQVRCIEIRQKRESTVEIDEREGLEAA